MPLYEYYCEPCNGVFEALRPMREAAEPVPCPECYKEGQRIMPTSFAAFTFREGYPRRIPDDGTYYHLGKKVRNKIRGGVRPNEHPEINKPKPKPRLTKGERQDRKEMRELAKRGKLVDQTGSPVSPSQIKNKEKTGLKLKQG